MVILELREEIAEKEKVRKEHFGETFSVLRSFERSNVSVGQKFRLNYPVSDTGDVSRF